MFLKSVHLKICFLVVALIVSGCEKKNDSPSSPTSSSDPTEAGPSGDSNVPAEVAIGLQSVSNDECLNVARYFELIRSLPGTTSARKYSKDLILKTTGASLPRNAYLRAVAGNFRFLDTGISQIPDFPQLTQEGCGQIKFNPEGYDLVYKITSAKKDSVTYQNEWDGQTTVTWKTPNSLELTTTSVVYDNLCNSDSRAKLTVVEKISWGHAGIFRSGVETSEISSDFLSLVSEAKGVPVSGLYSASLNSENVDGGKLLSVEKLKELQLKPTRSELDQCY